MLVLMQPWPWGTFGDKQHEKNTVNDTFVAFLSFSWQPLPSLNICKPLIDPWRRPLTDYCQLLLITLNKLCHYSQHVYWFLHLSLVDYYSVYWSCHWYLVCLLSLFFFLIFTVLFFLSKQVQLFWHPCFILQHFDRHKIHPQ